MVKTKQRATSRNNDPADQATKSLIFLGGSLIQRWNSTDGKNFVSFKLKDEAGERNREKSTTKSFFLSIERLLMWQSLMAPPTENEKEEPLENANWSFALLYTCVTISKGNKGLPFKRTKWAWTMSTWFKSPNGYRYASVCSHGDFFGGGNILWIHLPLPHIYHTNSWGRVIWQGELFSWSHGEVRTGS